MIGYEIIWIRMVGVLVKDSPYFIASLKPDIPVGIAREHISTTIMLDEAKESRQAKFIYSLWVSDQFCKTLC